MGHSQYILVINSDKAAREAIGLNLHQSGYSDVDFADSGNSAITLLNENSYDVIVTDIGKSGMGGWKLARFIRSGSLATTSDAIIIAIGDVHSERLAEATASAYEINRFVHVNASETIPTIISDILTVAKGTPKHSLLVIEDYPDTIKLVKRILGERFDIDVAMDGDSGFRLWSEKRHSLVLLDIMLPKKSGAQVLKEILDIEPEQSIIAMTAHCTPEAAARLLIDGAIDYLPKPFRTAQLRKVTEIALRREDFIISNNQYEKNLEELKKSEEKLRQAQKMEAIGQLTGGIAHDFNNMLASILGYTSLAKEKFSDVGEGKLAKYLDEVTESGKKARDLVAQMLAFSRGGSTESVPLNITPPIKDAIMMLRSIIPTTIDLVINLDEEIPVIKMDAIQLHQIILNLCINARDSIENEIGTIYVESKCSTLSKLHCSSCTKVVNGHYVSIIIRDSGTGIDVGSLQRIFDPFFTTKEVGKGTGMGLSMVHGIVHEHGGHIIVESAPETGTSFTILFPVFEGVVFEDDMQTKLEHTTEGKGRVLVVDDDPTLSGYLEEMLNEKGFEVEAYTSPIDALHCYESSDRGFDLVLTDQTMPGIPGDMLAQEILKKRPDQPIILCSGYSERINEETAKSMNISGYLTKPVQTDNLISMMNDLISKSRQANQLQ